MSNCSRRLEFVASIGLLASLTGCAASMQGPNSFRSFEPMAVPQNPAAAQAARMAAARQGPPAAGRARPASQVVQASATVAVPKEQLIAPEPMPEAGLTVAPRRAIHDPQDLAPVPPPVVAQAAPVSKARPEQTAPRKVASAKPVVPKTTKPAVAPGRREDVAVVKPSRTQQPARRPAPQVELASSEVDEEPLVEIEDAETPRTQLTPVAKLPKKTIASKGPQWRPAGTLVAAEPPQTLANEQPKTVSRVHPARWETNAHPAPAASIDDAVYETEEAADEAAESREPEASDQAASTLRIVGMSGE